MMKTQAFSTRLRAMALVGGMALLSGCGQQTGETSDSMTSDQTIPTVASPQDWQKLSQLRIVFGHQSVGEQVISGLQIMARENNAPLTVAETREPFSGPALHHFMVGQNGDPRGKLQDFDATIANGLGAAADIALMKLCYVDFDAETNPKQLAQAYMAELDKLTAQYPDTIFVPVTAPLTTVQTGPKALLKKILGKSPGGYDSNEHRKVFNDTLRAHYVDNPVLFDIAAIESGFGRTTIEHDGQRIEILNEALTSDGGHLNAQGERLVASALAHHLASVARPRAGGE